MACIVAFLLIASSKYQTSNHLIFVTSEISDDSYRVFAHQGNEFPQADDILMTASPIEGTGTSTAVYCSVALGDQQIIARLKRTKLLHTDLAYKYINPQPDKPVTCWV
ncbi:BgtE-10106 [Blumeria graminis f. sp. tritici]|uniref:BgtE-10106 n=2 Tax=Blumeria graminis f. sp. tritici TaxID=62690 RepID=A0A9X9MMS3_BLUGR|nr:putative secreted effector protein [Blumeria graminis f. sp. tritici 96224]VDB93596.1 BgtE-10106 [Blumeria graminis f. sp. tritici]